MSIPYLVHKDDADDYDAREEETAPIRGDYRAKDEEITRSLFSRAHTKEQGQKAYQELYDEFIPLFDAINKKYKAIRIVSAFDTQPKNMTNYYTYYRGMRWGDSAGCEMMSIAKTGIDNCKKALKAR